MALGLGLGPSPPTTIPSTAVSPPSFGSTWGNPRYHITSLHISSAFHHLLLGPRDPHSGPHPPPWEESSTLVFNKGYRREPSLPVWLDYGTTSPSL